MSFLFFLLSTANAFDINVDKYKTNNVWYNGAPKIIVCDDSPVTIEQVKNASSEWNKKEKRIGAIRKEIPGECNDKHEKGYTLIMGDRDDLDSDKYHAITIRWYDHKSTKAHKIVNSAFIEIDPTSVSSRPQDVHKLLTHELGHALGYQHTHIKNDVMIAEVMK